LAKGLLRAEREMFRAAVAQAVRAQNKREASLPGRITIVSYTLSDEGASILVAADVHVELGPPKRSAPEQAASAPLATQPASAPASAPAKKARTYEDDEPAD
jgi:hypothetical protein